MTEDLTHRSMNCKPIGYVTSPYQEKFGIPRQAGLVPEAQSVLRLLPEYGQEAALRGLSDFSHIWVIFVFHATQQQAWRPTVRPPRLGGNQRQGVFASRSMFRPNPIGLSAVKLKGIHKIAETHELHLQGADLLDGTPVLDIKPYLRYADSIEAAQADWVQQAPMPMKVYFSVLAQRQCEQQSRYWEVDILSLIQQILQQDPRPAYRVSQNDAKIYRMCLYDFDVRWCYQNQAIEVLDLIIP